MGGLSPSGQSSLGLQTAVLATDLQRPVRAVRHGRCTRCSPMSRAPMYVVLSAAFALTACLDDLPGGGDDDLLIEAGGASYTPDKMIRVANVNFYKGSFGEMKTDARNFLEYLSRGKYVPDIFTVQNLNHNG